jgi:hypothetical protein
MKILKAIITIGIGLLPALTNAAILTGPVTNSANGHTYYLLSSSGWIEAEGLAQTMGGHLATVRNQAENDWIIDTFESFSGQHRDLWIGLNDAANEGVQVWASGEISTWRPFGSQDNTPVGDEDYVHIIRLDVDPNRIWNDFPEAGARPCYGVVEVIPQRAPVVSIRVSEVQLCWDTTSNASYQLQYRSLLTSNQWTPLYTNFISGSGSTFCTNDVVVMSQPQRYYRVVATTGSP